MPNFTKAEAVARALEEGATQAEIDRQAANYVQQVGSVPFRNMIVALTLPVSMSLNTQEDWTRLAAALTAMGMARRKR